MGGGALFGAIAVGLAGGGLYWWYTAQKPKDPEEGTCESLCALAGPAYSAACTAACNIGGAILAVVPDPFHNGADQWDSELARRQTNNDSLNGPRDIELDALPSWAGNEIIMGTPLGNAGDVAAKGVKGGPVRYANGCEPYFGAPGWSKCAAGTLDMYAMAIDAAAGTDRGFNEAHTTMMANQLKPSLVGGGRYTKLQKNNFMTGAVGDPTTQGPQAAANGGLQWLVRGKLVLGPQDLVPRAIAMQLEAGGGTEAQVTAAIAALTDEQASELIDPATAWSHTTHYDCSNIAGTNLTWDAPTSSWRRMRAGEKQNLGPCGKKSGTGGVVSKASNTTTLGTIFGFGILGL